DFAGAIGALPLGHGHPAWRAAIHRQVDELGLVSNLYATGPQAELAARLAELLPVPEARVFFSNSGAEANEAALKLVRRWGLPRGRGRIVALDGSFHGRSVATLAATGQPAKRVPFEPLVDWFVHVPPGDLEAMDRAVGAETAAVLLEPVMGEGGVHPLEPAYLRGIRQVCDERGALMMADEVQSGIGRCGAWLAVCTSDVVPDVVTLAKGLGGGLPIGATVTRADLALGPGEHASTFGGGPVVCAAALAVLETIEREHLLENARAQGERLRAAVRALEHPAVVEVRGAGLLNGIQLRGPDVHEVVLAMLERGVLATEAGPDVVRLSPPLVVTAAEVDEAVAVLGSALDRLPARAAS
ncbi:MAG TPA: aminotransferase class III-fold pyridoxal phosphate-dependent enzyme, partial [Actinomycetota bacterium]|nr:aminotransferase class III-fold pyridoxal phosphate-dependent enzyme [Actinomycetota bacterium]